jgi:hypothetical protein
VAWSTPPNHRRHPANFLRNPNRFCYYVTAAKLLLQANEDRQNEKALWPSRRRISANLACKVFAENRSVEFPEILATGGMRRASSWSILGANCAG